MNHTLMTPRKLAFVDFEITSAARAYEMFRPLRNLEVEEVWTLALSPSLKLLNCEMIFRGTVNSCLIHPREIFRFALLNNASNLILAHNHPSQERRPSPSDLAVTKQLVEVGKLIEIPMLDHLLITGSGYESFRENCWAEF